jgi:peptide/nickel transport system ATP-binding protein
MEERTRRLIEEPLLKVDDLVVEFRMDRRRMIQAVAGVSFEIGVGETLGLVGESGCGKSTLARTMVYLHQPSAGEVIYCGKRLSRCTAGQLREIRPQIQMIFQDAIASLNPGRKIGKTIEEPLRVLGRADPHQRSQQVKKMMRAVGLDPEQMAASYPFAFSGGQCQRVSLARALIVNPRLLICDEPVSSLDVSVQAQILNLLEKLKQRFKLTMLFISHDLAVVKNISDRVAVMYLGKLCEVAAAEDLYRSPRHPYSALLLASIAEPDPDLHTRVDQRVDHDMPSPVDPPTGCRFHPRCPRAQALCSQIEPRMIPLNGDRQVACHFPL